MGTDQEVPGAVANWGTYTALVAGGTHTCGLATDGTAYCWGNNQLVPVAVIRRA